jgi:two-component system alkaline phosphatase synthesis response regulator PhoP
VTEDRFVKFASSLEVNRRINVSERNRFSLRTGLAPHLRQRETALHRIYPYAREVGTIMETTESGLGKRRFLIDDGGVASYTTRPSRGTAFQSESAMDKPVLIQIIEDNKTFATGIKNVLEIEGYRVRVDHEGIAGLAFARSATADLVILDLMLPDIDGYRVLKALRDAGRTMPVLILSARNEEADKILGFRIGADDYVTKPFSLMELLARVRALLRRSRQGFEPEWAKDGVVRLAGNVEMNLRQRTVTRQGAAVALAPKQFDLLAALAARQGATVSRVDILKEVWGYRHEVVTRTVDTHILELRKKLEVDAADPKLIVTVRRTGYRLAMDGTESRGRNGDEAEPQRSTPKRDATGESA